MNRKWNEKTTSVKIANVISTVALCVWLLFEVLERTTLPGYAKFVNYIAVSVICVCEAVSFWNVKRTISYVAIAGAIFMLTLTILEALSVS